MDRLPKQSKDVKKSSKVKETKKCETSEQRAKRYSPFKALAVGGLLATAGMVEATRADATGPVDRMQHPYNRLPERYVPYKEFLEKMKKSPFYFGPKDAQATSSGETSQSLMETHQREQDKNKGKKHLSSNEKDIANLRALMEKAKDDPEVRQRVRKLIEVRQQQEQGRMLAEAPASDNTGTTVVLVHGFVGNVGDPVNCKGGYWGDAISNLKAQGYSDIRTVQYYTSDSNCDLDLHNPAYQYRCDGFNSGSEGTNNEDLNHVSCLLVQYLNQNFAGQKVILAGHSMGGIVIRNAMRLVQDNGGQFGFPDDIGHVTDAVTFNSPHAGVVGGGSVIACFPSCTQVNELTAGSDFMNTLNQNAQNPQTSAGFTQWTVVGSECDPFVGSSLNPDGAANAVAMDASHAIMFTKDNSATCYDHGGALHDSNTANDATLYYCDTMTPNVPCGTDYQNQAATVTQWVKTTTGSHGLQTLYKAVQQ